MKMKHLSIMLGILTLAAAPGHSWGSRAARLPVSPAGASKRPLRAPKLRLATAVSRMGPIPVAIDSETGEPCYVSTRLAKLLKG